MGSKMHVYVYTANAEELGQPGGVEVSVPHVYRGTRRTREVLRKGVKVNIKPERVTPVFDGLYALMTEYSSDLATTLGDPT